MSDVTPRRNSRTVTDFQSSRQNGRNASEAPAAVKVSKVRGLDGLPTRVSGHGGHRHGGCEGARGAHSESLSDRQLVLERHAQLTGSMREQSVGDVLRYGEGVGNVRT